MNTFHSAPDGIILFAHGSRDRLWRGPIEAVAQRIRADQPSRPVSCAYLELCEPSLQDAVALMIHQLHHAQTKALVLRIVPMFLGMGKHAREDLPELAIQLRATHPQVTFEIAATIGEDERVTRLLAHIAAH